MKPLDFTSTLIAGLLGAVLLAALGLLYSLLRSDTEFNFPLLAAAGFVVGAGVQTGVRLTGVS